MQAWGSRTQPPELARMKQWDPSNPLILHDSQVAPSSTGRRVTFGVGGDAMELHQNLYACLKVGRLERASTILDRLSLVFEPTAPEMVDAHNIFLQTLFEMAQQESKPDAMARVEEWYASNMQDKGIQPNAQTFVTLLRAAINFLDGEAQDEAIRKYMAMAEAVGGGDMLMDIDHSTEFSEEEWDVLIRAQPEVFDEPPSVHEVQEQLVNTPAAQKGLIEHGLPPNLALDIRAVPQKGLGLDALRQALKVFTDSAHVPYPHDMEGTKEQKDRAYDYSRQVQMEQDALEAAVQRWRQEDEKLQKIGINGVICTKPIQALMHNWYLALVPLFQKHIQRCKKVMDAPSAENAKDPSHTYGPWLEQLKPEKLAALTIARAVASAIKGEKEVAVAFKVSALSSALGMDFMNHLNGDIRERRDAFLRKQRKQLRMELLEKLHKTNTASTTPASQTTGHTAQFEKVEIPLTVRVKMGALALELLMQACTITVTAEHPKTGETMSSTQAAFLHRVGFSSGKRVGWIQPHHRVAEKLRNDSVQHILPSALPMIVEPKAWSSFEDGGYFTTPQRVVRQKAGDVSQRAYAHSAIENGDMNKVLAGLDVLGKVPWQINASVLDVMAQVWNKGESTGGLIPEETNVEPPEEPPADSTPQQRARYGKELQAYENLKAGLHSQRCFQNFQLETARAFANEKKIFFPHSVDFRGRAYPIPPILNHIGSDVARGLLRFAHGKELGTVGLQWLKIHLANLYGFDKASLKEREQFAMDNLGEIYDSATNPLDGRRWWTKAEDPWQCLACCMELKSAFDSPDPTRFMSQLPVHQDGTCNGLQHYAALGGDHAGARQVNLEPSDRPQDIYTGVAELVKEMVAKEAGKGFTMAEFINGHITRKVVKRTVMTNVYGVTFMGAKAQVEDELRDLFPNFKETEKVRSLGGVALYVAFKIFDALGKIFNGAQEIQYWLGECGERITTSLDAEQIRKIQGRYEGRQLSVDPRFKQPKKKCERDSKKADKDLESFRTSIIWTTPLKMPIVQPYRKDSTKSVKTNIQEITVMKRSPTDAVDKRKQLQAFPPNFIHSLDATHMTLSALKCSEMGLDFAAVHDSFWTHASDIPNLNVILRDAFVRMHSEDIVARLAEEFKARYAGAMYCASIFTTSEAGAKIRQWRVNHHRETKSKRPNKQGSATHEELALESRRQELLNSEDPEDVERGRNMVTPTSIWLEHQDPKALSSFRLSLLGETKGKKNDKAAYESMRNKVLDREAEHIAEAKAQNTPAEEIVATSETIALAETTEEEAHDAEPIQKSERPTAAKLRASRSRGETNTLTVWTPLTFPPVPQKGGWDVSRLRESKYFFS
jgi:DNA-directed RNA polymerase